eukprot:scaffold2302_cov209-Ochromonas_danica.AAC.9
MVDISLLSERVDDFISAVKEQTADPESAILERIVALEKKRLRLKKQNGCSDLDDLRDRLMKLEEEVDNLEDTREQQQRLLQQEKQQSVIVDDLTQLTSDPLLYYGNSNNNNNNNHIDSSPNSPLISTKIPLLSPKGGVGGQSHGIQSSGKNDIKNEVEGGGHPAPSRSLEHAQPLVTLPNALSYEVKLREDQNARHYRNRPTPPNGRRMETPLIGRSTRQQSIRLVTDKLRQSFGNASNSLRPSVGSMNGLAFSDDDDDNGMGGDDVTSGGEEEEQSPFDGSDSSNKNGNENDVLECCVLEADWRVLEAENYTNENDHRRPALLLPPRLTWRFPAEVNIEVSNTQHVTDQNRRGRPLYACVLTLPALYSIDKHGDDTPPVEHGLGKEAIQTLERLYQMQHAVSQIQSWYRKKEKEKEKPNIPFPTTPASVLSHSSSTPAGAGRGLKPRNGNGSWVWSTNSDNGSVAGGPISSSSLSNHGTGKLIPPSTPATATASVNNVHGPNNTFFGKFFRRTASTAGGTSSSSIPPQPVQPQQQPHLSSSSSISGKSSHGEEHNHSSTTSTATATPTSSWTSHFWSKTPRPNSSLHSAQEIKEALLESSTSERARRNSLPIEMDRTLSATSTPSSVKKLSPDEGSPVKQPTVQSTPTVPPSATRLDTIWSSSGDSCGGEEEERDGLCAPDLFPSLEATPIAAGDETKAPIDFPIEIDAKTSVTTKEKHNGAVEEEKSKQLPPIVLPSTPKRKINTEDSINSDIDPSMLLNDLPSPCPAPLLSMKKSPKPLPPLAVIAPRAYVFITPVLDPPFLFSLLDALATAEENYHHQHDGNSTAPSTSRREEGRRELLMQIYNYFHSHLLNNSYDDWHSNRHDLSLAGLNPLCLQDLYFNFTVPRSRNLHTTAYNPILLRLAKRRLSDFKQQQRQVESNSLSLRSRGNSTTSGRSNAHQCYLKVKSYLTNSVKIDRRLLSTSDEWALAVLMTQLSPHQVCQTINLLLLEQSLVIVGSRPGVVTAVCLGIHTLLRPFVWEGLFLPLVPHYAHDLFAAPVPLIVGTLTPPRNDEVSESTAILYLCEEEIILNAPDQGRSTILTKQEYLFKFGDGAAIPVDLESQLHLSGGSFQAYFSRLPDLSADLIVDEDVFRRASHLRRGLLQYALPRLPVISNSGHTSSQQPLAPPSINSSEPSPSISSSNSVLKDQISYKRFLKTNASTKEDEFYPDHFLEPLRCKMEFQEAVVHTQLFVSFVDKLRKQTELLDHVR